MSTGREQKVFNVHANIGALSVSVVFATHDAVSGYHDRRRWVQSSAEDLDDQDESECVAVERR